MDKIRYVGYVLIVWGVVDLALSYMGTDVWGEWFGIELEGFLYTWSGAVAIILGGILTRIGGPTSGKAE